MSILIRIEGPQVSKSITLDAGAPAMVLGRDPSVAIHLPDPERSISRKHLALQCSDQGLLVTVLSSVSGIVTPRGEVAPGQQSRLGPGDTAQFGPYLLTVSEGGPATAPALSSSDPFAALGLGRGGTPVGSDDPFQRAEFRKPVAPAPSLSNDPFSALGVAPPVQRSGTSFSGLPQAPSQGAGLPAGAVGSAVDPLAMFSGGMAGTSAPARSIDEWLSGGSSGGGGLGASTALKDPAGGAASSRGLATDHVHDFNLPLNLGAISSAPLGGGFGTPAPASRAVPAAPPPTPPARPAPPTAPKAPGQDDPWADLQVDWTGGGASKSSSPGPGVSAAPAALASHHDDPFDHGWADVAAWAGLATPAPGGASAPAPAVAVDATVPAKPGDKEPGVAPTAAASMPLPTKPMSTASVAAPGRPASPGMAADEATALTAFCKGLGLAVPGAMDAATWERIGATVRLIVQGMTDLMSARAELKRELRAEDRTMLAARDNNPLKSDVTLDEVMQYLLFNPSGVGGYMPADRALRESIDELRAHELATVVASRAAVEGALQEFEPDKLRAVLAKGKSKLPGFLDNARLWEAYVLHYRKHSLHMADWLEQIFNRNFMPAYSRESERLRNAARAPLAPELSPASRRKDPPAT